MRFKEMMKKLKVILNPRERKLAGFNINLKFNYRSCPVSQCRLSPSFH